MLNLGLIRRFAAPVAHGLSRAGGQGSLPGAALSPVPALAVAGAAALVSSCALWRQPMPGAGKSADYRKVAPETVFEPVGPFQPGQWTTVYIPLVLKNAAGDLLHPPVERADLQQLIASDRRFIYETKDSPLRGYRYNEVNTLLAREPYTLTLTREQEEKLRQGRPASEAIAVGDYHRFLEDLVRVHPDYFGKVSQGKHVEAVYLIPTAARDQAFWFRHDQLANLVLGAVRHGRIEDLPELTVPFILHGIGTETGAVDLTPLPGAGVPQSSVTLFHEKTHVGACRASDEYTEELLNDFLTSHPREKALLTLLEQPLDLGLLPEELLKQVPPDQRRTTVLTLLLRTPAGRRTLGRLLGPNVLPYDPQLFEEVWYPIPGFRQALDAGTLRIVRGGFYFADHFARLQVLQEGAWRDTYMADSHNPAAPVGPILEDCLRQQANMIDSLPVTPESPPPAPPAAAP